jgi:hypothetical protein
MEGRYLQPLRKRKVMLAEITAELEAFAGLEPGWDGAMAPPVDATALYVAADLLRSIDRAAVRHQVRWTDPQAAPDPDTGGVDLVYCHGDCWLMLSVPPGEDYSVVVVSQRAGEEAALRRVSRTEAIEEACSMMDPVAVVAARSG